MADRYQNILTTAYASFLNAGVMYPATGNEAKPVLQDSQKQKIAALVNDGASSLNTTLGGCGQVLSNAQNGHYLSKSALENEVNRNTPLLKAQVLALAALFDGFKREEDAWIKLGGTLSWDARAAAVKASRAVAATFVAAVQDLQNTVDKDLAAAVAAYAPTPAPTPTPQPTPEPTPTPTPTPQPTPKSVDWEGQREALLDAALDGALFVVIDTAIQTTA